MTKDGTDPLEVARLWRTAVEIGDMAALAELYDPGARIWTNLTDREHSLVQHLDRVERVRASCTRWSYEDVRCAAAADGFVSRHVVRFLSGGTERSLPAALFATVRSGRIVRLEEYLAAPRVTPDR